MNPTATNNFPKLGVIQVDIEVLARALVLERETHPPQVAFQKNFRQCRMMVEVAELQGRIEKV